MTYAVLAVLMALQIGQMHTWTNSVDTIAPRPRPQDLMPLVEPLGPSPFSQPVAVPYPPTDYTVSVTGLHVWRNGKDYVVFSVVPAIQEAAPGTDPVVLRDPNNCIDGWISNGLYGNHCASRKYWTCKDKTNVLQVSEDGSGHWCVRF